MGLFHRIQTARGNKNFQQAAQGPDEIVQEVARVSRASRAGLSLVQRTATTSNHAWNCELQSPGIKHPEQQQDEGKLWLETLQQMLHIYLT